MTLSTSLEIIRDESAFLALEPHWESLHERSAVRTPFRTWDWSRLWWKHFHDQCKLRVGVLRDDNGIPLAIAPFVIGSEGSGVRRHLRHITLLGGIGDVASEGLDFLVPEGQESALLPKFAPMFHALRREWDVVDLPYIHGETTSLPAIESLLIEIGAAGKRSAPHCAHVMALPATWDELMATFSRNRRSDIRSKWKKLMQSQGAAITGGKELAGDVAMEALIGVHRLRFSETESTFLAPRALGFHRELVSQWMQRGRILISLLQVDGNVIAGRYGHVFNQRYWDYQSGYDDRQAALSVGNLNLAWAVQNAISLGMTEYDHLAGDQAYKQAWSTRTRQLLHLESFNRRSPKAALFRLTRSLKRQLEARRKAATATPSDSPATEAATTNTATA